MLPAFDAPPPQWLTQYMAGRREFPILSVMEAFDADTKGPGVPIYGVNMAVRREVAVALGGFPPDSFGAVWLGDGETGFLRRLAGAGHGLAYLCGAVVRHHIPPERMTPAYFCRRMANQGAADVYTDFHRAMPGRARLLRHALGLALRHGRTWALARALRGRTDPGALETQMAAAATLARLGYVLRLTWSARACAPWCGAGTGWTTARQPRAGRRGHERARGVHRTRGRDPGHRHPRGVPQGRHRVLHPGPFFRSNWPTCTAGRATSSRPTSTTPCRARCCTPARCSSSAGGRLRVDFLRAKQGLSGKPHPRNGDVILLATGGHGFEMLEEGHEIIEVKQGPYTGQGGQDPFAGIDACRGLHQGGAR